MLWLICATYAIFTLITGQAGSLDLCSTRKKERAAISGYSDNDIRAAEVTFKTGPLELLKN